MSIKPIDIHKLLEKQRKIAVLWHISDVRAVRPDLTNDQCWEVLQNAKQHHDATVGISWETLTITAEVLFPE